MRGAIFGNSAKSERLAPMDRRKLMNIAFVLINTSKGTINETAQSLIKIQNVSEVFSVAGDWDLVAVDSRAMLYLLLTSLIWAFKYG